MKIRSLIILAGSVTAVSAQTDFLRQIQITGTNVPLVYDMPVTTEKGTIASKPLEGEGAVVQLYASGLEASRFKTLPIKVAEDTVGAYYPKVTLQIGTQDPHTPPRTRADKPFAITFTVEHLLDTPDAPLYARTVELQRQYQLYDPITHTMPLDPKAAGSYKEYIEFYGNGTYYEPAAYHQLPVESSTSAQGKETYIAYTRPDASGRQYQLGAAAVEIWPVARGAVKNVTEGAKYTALPATAYVEMKDLYPLSSTYVQVYQGKPNLGTEGTILKSTVRTYDTPVPQDSVARLDEMDAAITGDGFYTIEVLTVTPFNNQAPERIGYTYIEIDRTIEVRANTTTSEK
jgi:hypothetical protein